MHEKKVQGTEKSMWMKSISCLIKSSLCMLHLSQTWIMIPPLYSASVIKASRKAWRSRGLFPLLSPPPPPSSFFSQSICWMKLILCMWCITPGRADIHSVPFVLEGRWDIIRGKRGRGCEKERVREPKREDRGGKSARGKVITSGVCWLHSAGDRKWATI